MAVTQRLYTQLYRMSSSGMRVITNWHLRSRQIAPLRRSERSGKAPFSISPKEEQDLRLNIVILVRELCYLPVTYYFAYKKYTAS